MPNPVDQIDNERKSVFQSRMIRFSSVIFVICAIILSLSAFRQNYVIIDKGDSRLEVVSDINSNVPAIIPTWQGLSEENDIVTSEPSERTSILNSRRAQQKDIRWKNAYDLTVGGLGYPRNESEHDFDRFPARAKSAIASGAWLQSTHSSGVYIDFITDSSEIWVNYTLGYPLLTPLNMPITSASGMDLFAMDERERRYRWVSTWAEPEFPVNIGPFPYPYKATIRTQYRIHLPLFNQVISFSIGVSADATHFEKVIRPSAESTIVWYGSGIAQGRSVILPSSSFVAQIGLQLYPSVDVLNFALAGYCNMDLSVAAILNGVPNIGGVVIDCLADMNESSIRSNAMPLLQAIRNSKGPSTPIFLVENYNFGTDWYDTDRTYRTAAQNTALKSVYDAAVAAGDNFLYYIDAENILGKYDTMAWTVDGVYPMDNGMYKIGAFFASYFHDFLYRAHIKSDVTREVESIIKAIQKSWVPIPEASSNRHQAANPMDREIILIGDSLLEMPSLYFKIEEQLSAELEAKEPGFHVTCNMFIMPGARVVSMREQLMHKLKNRGDFKRPLPDGLVIYWDSDIVDEEAPLDPEVIRLYIHNFILLLKTAAAFVPYVAVAGPSLSAVRGEMPEQWEKDDVYETYVMIHQEVCTRLGVDHINTRKAFQDYVLKQKAKGRSPRELEKIKHWEHWKELEGGILTYDGQHTHADGTRLLAHLFADHLEKAAVIWIASNSSDLASSSTTMAGKNSGRSKKRQREAKYEK